MGPISEEVTGIVGAHVGMVRDQVSEVVVATKPEEETVLFKQEAGSIPQLEALPLAEEVATVQTAGS